MSAFVAIFWVFATTAVAMLPVQKHYVPGRILLCLAPVVVIWLGVDHGWGAVLFGAFAVISMYRRPIKFYWTKWRQSTEEAQ